MSLMATSVEDALVYRFGGPLLRAVWSLYNWSSSICCGYPEMPLSGMYCWEETPGKTRDMLEWWWHTAGLGTPWDLPERTWRNFWGEVWVSLLRLLPHDLGLNKWKKIDVWMDERCFTGKCSNYTMTLCYTGLYTACVCTYMQYR